MFYDHEILTSRKHGVATIWLMATLGSRSSFKKVTRKAILDVNLPEACDTITDPAAPLALRLQGNLLYGVSRVFSQQCDYVFSDAQSLSEKMRRVEIMFNDEQTDHLLASTRLSQLNLPDDPDFNLDNNLGMDLALFGISSGSSMGGSLSPRTAPSSRTSLQVDEFRGELQLQLSQDDTSGVDAVDFDFDFDPGPQKGTTIKQDYLTVPGGILSGRAVYADNIFHITEDGELVDVDQLAQTTEHVEGADVRLSAVYNEETRSAGLEPQLHTISRNNLGFDEDMFEVAIGDETAMPMTVLPRTPTPTNANSPANNVRTKSLHPPAVENEIEASVDAPQVKSKVIKPRRGDSKAELSNSELSKWNKSYLATMAHAQYLKANRISVLQAKRNADFWMLDQGIGGVRANFGQDLAPHPLSAFSGPALLDVLMDKDITRKRSRSFIGAEDDSEDEPRSRVRLESVLQQGSVGCPVQISEDDAMVIQDGFQPESEVGRRAPDSLREHSSQMPWNISSRHGSAYLYASGQRIFSSSVAGFGGADFVPSSYVQSRRSRMPSSSPLFNKGRFIGEIESPTLPDALTFGDASNGSNDSFEDPFQNRPNESFQLYGPAADVSIQQASDSQWMANVLENEAYNFLAFLTSHVQSLVEEVNQENRPANTITFEELLRPEENSEIVAAQGLLHVLTLSTRGLMTVQQDVAFGDIFLRINDPVEGVSHKEEVRPMSSVRVRAASVFE